MLWKQCLNTQRRVSHIRRSAQFNNGERCVLIHMFMGAKHIRPSPHYHSLCGLFPWRLAMPTSGSPHQRKGHFIWWLENTHKLRNRYAHICDAKANSISMEIMQQRSKSFALRKFCKMCHTCVRLWMCDVALTCACNEEMELAECITPYSRRNQWPRLLFGFIIKARQLRAQDNVLNRGENAKDLHAFSFSNNSVIDG